MALGQEAPPTLVPWPMHEIGSLDDRPVNHDLPNDRRAIHDPAFHHRLDHTVYDCPVHDRLHDLPLDDAAFDDRSDDVPLDDATLEARRFVLIIDLDAAPNGSRLERIIIVFQRMPSAELGGGRGSCGHDCGRAGERGDAAYGECFHEGT
jgi:hypothetical protein